MNPKETRHAPEIIKENLAQIPRKEGQARRRLKKQCLLEPGQELRLPATFVEGLATRRNSTY